LLELFSFHVLISQEALVFPYRFFRCNQQFQQNAPLKFIAVKSSGGKEGTGDSLRILNAVYQKRIR